MGIHHSEFKEMFEFLKKDIPIPLNKALKKWERIKDGSESIKKEWIGLLEKKSTELMNDGYSVGTAMMKAWDSSYGGISEDCERYSVSLAILRDFFFEESLYKLERYEDRLMENKMHYCNKCGWFTWDSRKGKGYCNNFCIERKSLKDRCVSEVE